MIRRLLSVAAIALASCAPPTGPMFPERPLDSVPPPALKVPEPDIRWESDLVIGLTRALTEDRLVLLFFYHNYCQYCTAMLSGSFADENVKKVINTRFVAINVNTMESPFGAEAGVTMVPTLVVITMNEEGGEPVWSRVGYLDGTGMSRFLDTAMRKANDVRVR